MPYAGGMCQVKCHGREVLPTLGGVAQTLEILVSCAALDLCPGREGPW